MFDNAEVPPWCVVSAVCPHHLSVEEAYAHGDNLMLILLKFSSDSVFEPFKVSRFPFWKEPSAQKCSFAPRFVIDQVKNLCQCLVVL